MAIPIEGYSVVVQRERIQHLLDDQKLSVPNTTVIADDDLWRCSFMTRADADDFAKSLESLGLNASVGPDSDAVIISEFDGATEPYCEWLVTGKWEKAVIGWLAGTEPRSVVAREGWDPKIGSGLTYNVDKERLELVRVDGMTEVYRDKETGKEVYIGRTTTPVESLFESAGRIIGKHLRSSGQPIVTGAAVDEIKRAIAMLDEVLAKVSDNWRVHWFHGKGHLALGHTSVAYDSFHRAYELEKTEQAICRELAGTCLELGKWQEAVEVAERAVVLEPDNHELLTNLALAHLLAGHVEAAQKTIQAALRINPSNRINLNVRELIDEVAAGIRPRPTSMQEFRGPPRRRPLQQTQRKKFWQFWKK